MAKYIEANERIKHDYSGYLHNAKGQDGKSIDKAMAAIRQFEESTKVKPFKKFHRQQAANFKAYIAKQKNERTGRPLAHSTVDATLRLVKAFFHWLVSQPGYKRVLTYADVEYFNNTIKAGRIAHTARAIPYPSMQQATHAFQAMPVETDFDRRDKALFAFLMLVGARDGAAASMKLKHVNVDLGHVYHDAREVKTKAAKTFQCQFLPVDACYRECFIAWVRYLIDVKLFGPEDPLFPKAKIGVVAGQGFANMGLAREGYAGSAKINAIIRSAFAAVQMPQYTPHSLRKTLVKFGNEKCKTMEEWKAWSMNLGHENMATTFNSYLPVSPERQMELIARMAGD
ncbi:Site-specific recombinase XerD [Roseovarius nanhaiticus]|uniref:Site-specific recombinase XerD n=1 Tax=Roseovarius nanhaiticus TaxID=573024 RepID=A0A1N7F2R2_9RHOB|nr:site-specific integrase [Roseovarius nanhaiticus]SEK62628.1 Site-specific recombinase XerD [Roseovarius nanhaiticus]SIR94670.1 Site-specific recombinase XerD [Roseovarius nanhaiticus]